MVLATSTWSLPKIASRTSSASSCIRNASDRRPWITKQTMNRLHYTLIACPAAFSSYGDFGLANLQLCLRIRARDVFVPRLHAYDKLEDYQPPERHSEAVLRAGNLDVPGPMRKLLSLERRTKELPMVTR
mmetsp:Transcript_67423/g.180100  ORF Transcript_67423/g.180100 Transcript_67423/m.180100 type:complete len:130 (-) Transcript_67423:50-439(-)